MTKLSRAMSLQVKHQPEEQGQNLSREPETAQPCCSCMLGLRPPKLSRMALGQGVGLCHGSCRSLTPCLLLSTLGILCCQRREATALTSHSSQGRRSSAVLTQATYWGPENAEQGAGLQHPLVQAPHRRLDRL